MNTSENIKCVKLKEELVKRLKAGEFPFNARFPGVHELETEYGVSYVTALKSLKLLEAEGFLQCRRGVGYFTLYAQQAHPTSGKKLNVVLTEECWQRHNIYLESQLTRFRNGGWKIEIVPLKSTDVHEASLAINSPDAYTLIYCLTTDWSRFAATFTHVCNRVLVVGKLSGSSKVTSIICDESETVRQIIDYLHLKGRTRPGIFCDMNENELEMNRLGYWRQALQQAGISLDWIQNHIFPLTSDEDDRTHPLMRRQMTDCLRDHGREMDSIVFTYRKVDLREVCLSVGLRVPDDILPVQIASPSWQYGENVTYTILDNNLPSHFENAFNILEYRFATGKKEPGSWYFCQPLGIRETI